MAHENRINESLLETLGRITSKNQPREEIKSEQMKDFAFESLQKQINDEVRKLEKNITVSLITVFGVFASMVVFLAVDVQILKTVCDPFKMVGISLILLSSLLFFLGILELMGRHWIGNNSNKLSWALYGGISVIFVIGLVFLTNGNEQKCQENFIYKQYENDFEDRQLELAKTFDAQHQSNLKEIEALKSKVEQLELKSDTLKDGRY